MPKIKIVIYLHFLPLFNFYAQIFYKIYFYKMFYKNESTFYDIN